MTSGRAIYKQGKLYFNTEGWAMVLEASRKAKKSPKYIVEKAILRYVRSQSEKAKDA